MQITVPKNIMRFPRLDTVLMVEEFIRMHDGEFKKSATWVHLPKKMMYQTFCVIVDYLLHSRKISIDAEGKIGWIHYPRSGTAGDEQLFWRRGNVLKDRRTQIG